MSEDEVKQFEAGTAKINVSVRNESEENYVSQLEGNLTDGRRKKYCSRII